MILLLVLHFLRCRSKHFWMRRQPLFNMHDHAVGVEDHRSHGNFKHLRLERPSVRAAQ